MAEQEWEKFKNLNACLQAEKAGELTIETVTIVASFTKLGKVSKVVSALDDLDAFSQVAKLSGKLIKPVVKAGSKSVKFVLNEGVQLIKRYDISFKVDGNTLYCGFPGKVNISIIDKLKKKSPSEIQKLPIDENGNRLDIIDEQPIIIGTEESLEKIGNITQNGKFIDDILEADYQKYLKRKAKQGKTPKDRTEWKEARDYWLYDSPMARGNDFNKKAEKNRWYEYNEVHLENGKRLDSYDEVKGEIVSRKATDLENIELSTFESYLRELKNKYPEGMKIRSDKYKNQLDGKVLKGKQILEIPESNKTFDEIQEYIDLAKNKYNIEIRFRPE